MPLVYILVPPVQGLIPPVHWLFTTCSLAHSTSLLANILWLLVNIACLLVKVTCSVTNTACSLAHFTCSLVKATGSLIKATSSLAVAAPSLGKDVEVHLVRLTWCALILKHTPPLMELLPCLPHSSPDDTCRVGLKGTPSKDVEVHLVRLTWCALILKHTPPLMELLPCLPHSSPDDTCRVGLKGTPSKDARWPENVQIFLFVGFLRLFLEYFFCNKSPFLPLIWAPCGKAMLLCSLQMKSRNGLAHDITDTSCHTCQPCSLYHRHRIPHTKWQYSQHGFAIFKPWFF